MASVDPLLCGLCLFEVEKPQKSKTCVVENSFELSSILDDLFGERLKLTQFELDTICWQCRHKLKTFHDYYELVLKNRETMKDTKIKVEPTHSEEEDNSEYEEPFVELVSDIKGELLNDGDEISNDESDLLAESYQAEVLNQAKNVTKVEKYNHTYQNIHLMDIFAERVDSTARKKVSRRSYTIRFKCKVLEHVKETCSNRATARFFGIDESLVRGWLRNEEELYKAAEKVGQRKMMKLRRSKKLIEKNQPKISL